MAQHTNDLRNVEESDYVTICTTEGTIVDATCVDRFVERADPRTGEVRKTTFWHFETPFGKVAATILDGLKSSPDDSDFPQHSELWNMDEEETMGYIETLK